MNLRKNESRIGGLLLVGVLLTVVVLQHRLIDACKAESRRSHATVLQSLKGIRLSASRLLDVSLNGVDSLVFPERDRLVYCITSDMCDSCIEEDLEVLYRLCKDSVRVIVAEEEDEMKKFPINGLLKSFQCSYLPGLLQNIPVEKSTGLSLKFLAYVGDDSKIRSIYFPMKGEQWLTEAYVRMLLEELVHKG